MQGADQVAAHRAADAAVVHLDQLFLGAHDQVAVDADLAEFVDDDGIAPAAGAGQDAVEQGRLPGAQEARQHHDRNTLRHRRLIATAATTRE
jgi:hypothetical protein